MISLAALAGSPPVVGAPCTEEIQVVKQEHLLTFRGEIVDMTCYMGNGIHNPGYRTCAADCARSGSVFSLISAGGTEYMILPDHSDRRPYEKLQLHLGDQVKVTGHLLRRGVYQGVVVKSVEKEK